MKNITKKDFLEEFRQWCFDNDLTAILLINAGPNMEGYSLRIDSMIDGKNKDVMGGRFCHCNGSNLSECIDVLKGPISQLIAENRCDI